MNEYNELPHQETSEIQPTDQLRYSPYTVGELWENAASNRDVIDAYLQEVAVRFITKPPFEMWHEVEVPGKEAGQVEQIEVPFSTAEVEEINKAAQAYERISRHAIASSGPAREFWINVQSFPLLHEDLTDRRKTVWRLLQAAHEAETALLYEHGNSWEPEGQEAEDYTTIFNLPEKLFEGRSEENP